MLVAQSCLTLSEFTDCSLPGSSVHGILPVRILGWVAISSSRHCTDPDVIVLEWGVLQLPPTKHKECSNYRTIALISMLAKGKEREVAQLCPTFCYSMYCSLPGSSVHGIFQAIVLEWIAISFSRGSSQPRDQTQVSQIADRRFTD